jgi:hypothetical protein
VRKLLALGVPLALVAAVAVPPGVSAARSFHLRQRRGLPARFVGSARSYRISVAPSDLGTAGARSPLSLSVTGFVLAPAAPVAGKSLSATVRLLRRDTFDPVTSGLVRCTLRVGTRTVAARASAVARGAAALQVDGAALREGQAPHRYGGRHLQGRDQ